MAKALDPVLAAIMATLARLTLAVELLGPQTKPQGVLAGGECSATPSHTCPVKLKAPEPSRVADTRLPSATEPAREETRAPAASGMPNAWLPGADGGATPSHQPRRVETAAKVKGPCGGNRWARADGLGGRLPGVTISSQAQRGHCSDADYLGRRGYPQSAQG